MDELYSRAVSVSSIRGNRTWETRSSRGATLVRTFDCVVGGSSTTDFVGNYELGWSMVCQCMELYLHGMLNQDKRT